MYRIDLNQAKAEFETVIQAALNGEDVVITQNGEPILQLSRTADFQSPHNGGSGDDTVTDSPQFPHIVRTERGLSIAGTRITLYQVMDQLRAEWPWEKIRDLYHLTDEQIGDVRGYIAMHRDAVDAEYDQVLKRSAEIRAYWEERNRERLEEIADLPPKPGQELLYAKLQSLKERLGIP